MNKKQITLKTPYYYYDLEKVSANAKSYRELAGEKIRILYATMANPRLEIIKAVHNAGLGVFVNSTEHLNTALEVGMKPENIVFAGSGHSIELMNLIARMSVSYHADSVSQFLTFINQEPKGKIGLRVNVGSLLNLSLDKDPAPRLGMTIEEIEDLLKRFPNQITTLHVYVGTNLTNSNMHCRCLKALVSLCDKFPSITDLDLGGGFAFSPGDSQDHGMWRKVLTCWEKLVSERNNLQLTIEPGRSIVRTAGKLYVTVTDVKKRGKEYYVMVNTSGTWFPRKLMHGIDEEIVEVAGLSIKSQKVKTHICGSTTYSKDFLTITKLPKVKIGDIICFTAAGAYNEAMHSDFLGVSAPEVCFLEAGNEWVV